MVSQQPDEKWLSEAPIKAVLLPDMIQSDFPNIRVLDQTARYTTTPYKSRLLIKHDCHKQSPSSSSPYRSIALLPIHMSSAVRNQLPYASPAQQPHGRRNKRQHHNLILAAIPLEANRKNVLLYRPLANGQSLRQAKCPVAHRTCPCWSAGAEVG